MGYPDYFLRGLSSKDCIVDGRLVAGAFNGFTPSARHSDYEELSINWLDDNGAIDEAQNKKKGNGEVQFKFGVAILSRNRMDMNLKHYRLNKNDFDYERHKIPGNEYHGNLLASKALKPQIRKVIIGALCLCMENHLPRPE